MNRLASAIDARSTCAHTRRNWSAHSMSASGSNWQTHLIASVAGRTRRPWRSTACRQGGAMGFREPSRRSSLKKTTRRSSGALSGEFGGWRTCWTCTADYDPDHPHSACVFSRPGLTVEVQAERAGESASSHDRASETHRSSRMRGHRTRIWVCTPQPDR